MSPVDLTGGVVFDLDDTLYLERDYVSSGFRHVARRVSRTDDEAERVYAFLWDLHERGVRGDTFDRLLAAFPGVAGRAGVPELVAWYRTHRPDIAPAAGAPQLLATLAGAGYGVALVTDGPPESQRAKIEALGLDGVPAVLTGRWGAAYSKPHERGYRRASTLLGLDASRLVYVGDNPAKDFLGARRLGWRTVRVRCAGQLHEAREPVSLEYAPDVEVSRLCDVGGLVAS